MRGTLRVSPRHAIFYATGCFWLASIRVVNSFTVVSLPSLSSSLNGSIKLPPRWASLPKEKLLETPKTPIEESSPQMASRTESRLKLRSFYKLPKKAYRIYADYATRLWRETNTEARKKVANDKVKGAIRNMRHVLKSDEYSEFSDGSAEARDKLLEACDNMLVTLPTNLQISWDPVPNLDKNIATEPIQKSKGHRSILFGAVMGAAVACWVFSGNYVFTGLFALMTILGQLEYYRMVMNTGVYPARRISVIGAVSCFLTALFAPELHQICLPWMGTWAMIWFLTMRRQVSSISEIATTFTGMFYLGYVPSFWVRTRLIGFGREPTRLAPLVAPILDTINQRVARHFGTTIKDSLFYLPITTGAIFIFWTWLCLAFNDVGAYFVGRKYGKTKLGSIAPAAGATSPKKSVQGVIGGCSVSAALGILGAWVQKWPYFVWTGALHGVLLGFLGLIGDLTASMLKRDAGLKDFGDLIPEHGGIMDRVDGFIWTAPYSWFVCSQVIPALKAVSTR